MDIRLNAGDSSDNIELITIMTMLLGAVTLMTFIKVMMGNDEKSDGKRFYPAIPPT